MKVLSYDTLNEMPDTFAIVSKRKRGQYLAPLHINITNPVRAWNLRQDLNLDATVHLSTSSSIIAGERFSLTETAGGGPVDSNTIVLDQGLTNILGTTISVVKSAVMNV